MCLFTHFAAGALAGGVTGNPVAGVVTGLASHALLDAIPHYDHPDWRLELAGGVLGLILLLLMPFASLPAVLGGLAGMLPDLENLFQKLGKMRRDQFIFPSHTGLIPHGRTLGPRSLGWQVAIFVVCFALLGVLTPGTAQAQDNWPSSTAEASAVRAVMGQPVVQLLSSSQDRTVVRLDYPLLQAPADWQQVDLHHLDWGRPLRVNDVDPERPITEAPVQGLNVAVPTTRLVDWSLSGVSWWKEPSSPVAPRELVQLGPPTLFRSVPLVGGEIQLGAAEGVLRSVTIEIIHPAQGRPLQQLAAAGDMGKTARFTDEALLMPGTVLNREMYRALSQGGRTLAQAAAEAKAGDRGEFNHFDLTRNWVRLEVEDTGIFELTGQELAGMDVAAAGVDPLKLRLFQGGGLQLEQDPSLADSSQPQRVGLTEVPIQVLDGGDGEWNLDDSIRFYGVGVDTWRDRLDADSGLLEHYEHQFATAGVYWLTWESLTEASPIPGSPLRLADEAAGPTSGTQEATAWRRVHAEEATYAATGIVADNWSWNSNIYSTNLQNFNAWHPVADTLATFIVNVRANPSDYSSSNVVFINSWLNSDTANMGSISFTESAQGDSLHVRVVGSSASLQHGNNSFTVQNAGDSERPRLALDSMDLLYLGELDLRDLNKPLDFFHLGSRVQGGVEEVDFVISASDPARVLVWDVTDARSPRSLVGQVGGQGLTVGVTRSSETTMHLVAQDSEHLHAVSSGKLWAPADLRAQDGEVDYIVIYAEPFAQPAETLADYHDQYLTGVDSPVARAVLVDDIYAGFSGGRKDVLALRNYLKYIYDQGNRLKYVCLLGNASRDFRNYRGQTPLTDLVDWVPAELRTFYPRNVASAYTNTPYSSDDGLSSFDPAPSSSDVDFPDLATGRLPAATVAEANRMVQIMIDFAQSPVSGPWRNRITMVADDCYQPSLSLPKASEFSHMRQADDLVNFFIPGSIDVVPIYAQEYDFPPGSLIKPQVRTDILASLNAGTTIYHYIGHGAEDNLADEQIFQSRDIANLTSGMRRPLFVAFSCDVGVYDNPTRKSMAEVFVAGESGGAIGSICASQVSVGYYNDVLSEAFYQNLFPATEVVDDRTPGAALMLAKAAMPFPAHRKNSQRYNLLSDPGLRLPHPVGDLSFHASSVDTLRSGARQVVRAVDAGEGLLGAGDTYDLRVEESSFTETITVYTPIWDPDLVPPGYRYDPVPRNYTKLGATVFRGTGVLDGDELNIPFKVPAQLRYGDQASIRLVVDSGAGEHAVETRVPAVRSSTGPVDDVDGPSISMSFSNRYRVRPGDSLTATLSDTSGIALLGTSPGNSVLLEFDDSGFMTEVTDKFSYDANSYTTGRLLFPLPADIEAGNHTAALHASDALGNVGSDTLSFTVAQYAVSEINDLTLFPNPTPGPCRMVFDLTEGMELVWEIYTLAGRKIWSHRELHSEPGPGIMAWDGRDQEGDEIANGTYLFVVRGNPTAGDGHQLRKTGKLVIMR